MIHVLKKILFCSSAKCNWGQSPLYRCELKANRLPLYHVHDVNEPCRGSGHSYPVCNSWGRQERQELVWQMFACKPHLVVLMGKWRQRQLQRQQGLDLSAPSMFAQNTTNDPPAESRTPVNSATRGFMSVMFVCQVVWVQLPDSQMMFLELKG